MKALVNEFKTFIARGNVMELAVGVVMGSAFGKIVTSLVDNIIMPLLGVITGGRNLNEDLILKIGDSRIYFGFFLQSIIDFLLVALCLFLVLKFINKIMKKQKEEPKKADDIKLLEEIRDLLKEQK